jgi:hypothetical protein
MPDQVKTEGSTRLLNRDAPIHKKLHLAADADKMVAPTYLFERVELRRLSSGFPSSGEHQNGW